MDLLSLLYLINREDTIELFIPSKMELCQNYYMKFIYNGSVEDLIKILVDNKLKHMVSNIKVSNNGVLQIYLLLVD